MNKLIYFLTPFFVLTLFLSHNVVYAAESLVTLAAKFEGIFSVIIQLLSVLVFFFFVYNSILFIKGSGESKDDAKQELKTKLIWSVVILFVLFALWGLLAVFGDVLGIERAN